MDEKLVISLAKESDVLAMSKLMLQVHPDMKFDELVARTQKEIVYNQSSKRYRLLVARLDDKVVGFSRFYHSDELKKEKHIYPSPSGFYCMGTIVDPNYRRNKIATELSLHRVKLMQILGAQCAYSGVAATNVASIKMHEAFGFTKVSEIEGFLKVKFNCGAGFLYKKDLV